jgi:2-polyprenyl-6-methoxyphenol hydroxylase-like FAD-dependent oxidoreductase
MAEQKPDLIPDLIIVGGGIGGSALAAVMARAGHSVLMIEKTHEHVDKVRGEWMAPWGVKETQTLGLYDALIEAGGHHLTKAVQFDELVDADEALANTVPLNMIEGVPGPLCLGHPAMCNIFNSQALDAGVSYLRGVSKVKVAAGFPPRISFEHEGKAYDYQPKLIVGADGRASAVRKQIGVALEADPVQHFFSGLLVDGVEGAPIDTQWIGTEGDVHYLCFPQSETTARLYLGFSPDTPSRFSGEGGPQRFIDAFKLKSSPFAAALKNARPAGPCPAYPNFDTWTEKPFAEGVVLIGDAAGHNDPINGQGLSVTLRDVRVLSDLLLGNKAWSAEVFRTFAEARTETLRRLRFLSRLTAAMTSDFTPEGKTRRARALGRIAADETGQGGMFLFGLIAGPEQLPEEAFTQDTWDWYFAE